MVSSIRFFFVILDAGSVLHFFYRSLSVEKNSLKTRININRNNDYMYMYRLSNMNSIDVKLTPDRVLLERPGGLLFA